MLAGYSRLERIPNLAPLTADWLTRFAGCYLDARLRVELAAQGQTDFALFLGDGQRGGAPTCSHNDRGFRWHCARC